MESFRREIQCELAILIMNDKENDRRHFMGRAIGGTIGMGGGFASSFPVAERTRMLRGAEFPKEKNLDSAKAERQNHHLVLDFLDFEREYNKRTPRMNEKVFMDFLNKEKGLGEGEVRSDMDDLPPLDGDDGDGEFESEMETVD